MRGKRSPLLRSTNLLPAKKFEGELWVKASDVQAELAACKRERDALRQGIKPVVIWLRNGGDPIEASKELLLLLENGK
jgi:hypothetical protein